MDDELDVDDVCDQDTEVLASLQADLPLLARIAAHAPDAIPDWFEHVPMAKPAETMPDWRELPEHLQEPARAYLADALDPDWSSHFEFTAASQLAKFIQRAEEYRKAHAAWRRANHEARYFQWRVHFALRLVQEFGE